MVSDVRGPVAVECHIYGGRARSAMKKTRDSAFSGVLKGENYYDLIRFTLIYFG